MDGGTEVDAGGVGVGLPAGRDGFFLASADALFGHGDALVFGRDVLDGGGVETGGGEDLEIALGTPAPAGTVDDTAGGLVPCDLFERERGAEEVLGQAAAAFDVVGRDRFVFGVEVESAVFPAEKAAEILLADEFFPAQCLQKAVAKQFCQRLDGLDWHEVKDRMLVGGAFRNE